jgi:hypothetical protein
VTYRWALLALCAAGCSDVFALSIEGGADGPVDVGDLGSSMAGDDLAGGGGGGTGGGGGDGGGGVLPAACARLSCVPAMNEGDVQLDDNSGTISGCHAYKTLTITNTVRATQFLACAETINIGGAALDATGGGSTAAMGTGAGVACAVSGASGGGHGGAGADPAGCGGGIAFGDMTHPREPGSGGGGTNGGKGGGVIEFAAGTLNLFSIIRVNGTTGGGLSGGGGGGGSVLIDVDNGIGAGRIEAIGGAGTGISAGGGGGGRVAVYTKGAPVGFQVIVDGGPSSTGAAGGGGSVIK